jgi:F-type H+/Na+-transporting ATPase subunit beta
MNGVGNMISVSTHLLGRVVDSRGEPIDGKGPVADAMLLPLSGLSTEAGKQFTANQVFETGIKVLDLLAPTARGGISGLFADPGVGKLVTVEEIMHSIVARSKQSVMICLGMGENVYETSELMDAVREGGIESNVVMVFEQVADSPEIPGRVLQAGLTIAGHFREKGYEVLLVADKYMTEKGVLAEVDSFKPLAEEGAIATILQGSIDDYRRYEKDGLLHKVNAHAVYNRDLFKRQIYPAVDPLQSGSRLLDEGLVTPEHERVAHQVRQLLRRYDELRDVVEVKGDAGLSAEDQRVFRRGQRIEQYLTQPYVVAEPFTDIPGEYVRLEDTIRSFQALLDGAYDDVPEKAFWMVGDIDQAIAKGKAKA